MSLTDSLRQAFQFCVAYALILAMTVYLTVGIAVALKRLGTDLPTPIGRIAGYWQKSGAATRGGAIFAGLMLCVFLFPPLFVLVWPAGNISLVARLASLALLVAEAAWLSYLRRFLVTKRK